MAIYILWDRRFLLGAELGKELWEWMRGARHGLLGEGLGIPVFYRSDPEYAQLQWGDPIPFDNRIHLRDACLNVIVPLVDAHMIKSPAWSRTVVDFAAEAEATREEPGAVCLLPVMLHPAAPNIAGELRQINFIRLAGAESEYEAIARINEGRRGPAAPTAGEAELVAAWRARLRRFVTSAVAREVRSRWMSSEAGSQGAPLPLKVFVSHAKIDGREVAAKLREEVYRYGQIEAFFDEADLPFGYKFENILREAVKSSSAAVIAICSDYFSLRSWCREEVSLARRPLPVGGAIDADDQIFSATPVVAVDSRREYWSPTLGELSGVPTIRWSPDRAAEILDRMILESLLAGVHLKRARNHSSFVPRRANERRVLLSWVPDEYSMVHLNEALGPPGPVERVQEILHPGRSLPPAKVKRLAELFRGTQTTFSSHQPDLDIPSALVGQPVVAVSHGHWSDGPAIGYGSEHIDESAVVLCTQLMGMGARICYGGWLRDDNEFTRVLYEAAWAAAERAGDGAGPIILNPQAWDYHLEWSVSDEAQRHGILDLIRVGPQGPDHESSPIDPDAEQAIRVRAAALSWARAGAHHVDAPLGFRATLRVAIGGPLQVGAGRMPGVAEEILAALRFGCGVLILGGLGGGCCARIARYLLGLDPFPSQLTYETHEMSPSITALRGASRSTRFGPQSDLTEWAHADSETAFRQLREHLDALKATLDHSAESNAPIFGLTHSEYCELLQTRSLRRALRLVKKSVSEYSTGS